LRRAGGTARTITSAAEAPSERASRICATSTWKSFLRSGSATDFRARTRSSVEPPNLVGSVSTDIAAAPPASYALTCRARSSPGLMSPLDGDDRFTSAITPICSPRSASRNDGTASARRAWRSSSAARGASVAARARASSVNSPRVPTGGVQAEIPCASVDLRLT